MADQPDDQGGPVLQHRGEGGLELLRVQADRTPHALSWENTSSMTSSIGGSSTVRSVTGRSARSRSVTRAVSRLGNTQRGQAVLAGHHLPVGAQVRLAILQPDDDRLVGREALHQGCEVAVEEEPSVVDDDDPAAERLHVRHVVAGEEDGGAEPLAVFQR